MNDQLAKTLGIEFVEKRERSVADVTISKRPAQKDYNFSLSPRAAKKMGGYVRVGKSKTRIYIVPGCNDKHGFKLTGGRNSKRRYVAIRQEAIGLIDNFTGNHALKFDADLDAYYVTAED